METLYTQAYFSSNSYGADHKRAQMQAQEAGRIKQRIGHTPKNVLDVGCGIGDFLARHFQGWHKYGVEISEWAQVVSGKQINHGYIRWSMLRRI